MITYGKNSTTNKSLTRFLFVQRTETAAVATIISRMGLQRAHTHAHTKPAHVRTYVHTPHTHTHFLSPRYSGAQDRILVCVLDRAINKLVMRYACACVCGECEHAIRFEI